MGRVSIHGIAAACLAVVMSCGQYDPTVGRVGGPLPLYLQDAGGEAGPTFAHPILPCDVERVLKAKCQRCHRDPPQNKAPFHLLNWEDTQEIYLGKPRWKRMLRAIETDYMPYKDLDLDPPVESLTPDEKATMLNWLKAGAHPVDGDLVQCPE